MVDDLQYLILSLTSRCNLRCRYCYQFATSKGQDMPDEILERSLALADTGQPEIIQITGGEPTLVPDKIERVIEVSQAMKHRPQLAIQTNGTLLTESLVCLFKAHKIEIGVSLDGSPDIQERLRGRADATLKGLHLLEQAGIPFRVTTVVSGSNVFDLDKLVLTLAAYGCCRGIGLDLLVEKGRYHSANVFPPDAQQLEKGLRRMVSTLKGINARRKNGIRLRELDLVKQGSGGGNFCHAISGRSLAVNPSGSLSPCGQTMGDFRFALGTVFRPKKQSVLSLESFQLTSEACESCSLAGRCPGDCPSRLHYNRNSDETVPLACVLYKCLDDLG